MTQGETGATPGKPMIYESIIAVMEEINAVGKSRKNQQQGFQYRGIDDVMNELHCALSKCGVFVVPRVMEENRTSGKTRSGGDMFYTRLKISFTFYARDGSSVESVVIGEAMDTADKASNKALSVGLKYALLQVFCIPTEDEKDPDAQTPAPAPGSFSARPAARSAPPQEAHAPRPQTPKLPFAPKGGEATPEEKARIMELCGARYENGTHVFTREELNLYSSYRKDKTAQELIAFIENALRNRRKDAPELNAPAKSGKSIAEQAAEWREQREAEALAQRDAQEIPFDTF